MRPDPFIAHDLVTAGEFSQGVDEHFANAAQVYLGDFLGLDPETGKVDVNYEFARHMFTNPVRKQKVMDDFTKLYQPGTMIDSIWNTINGSADKYGTIRNREGFRSCIRSYLAGIERFAKPGTIEELLDPKHALSATAGEARHLGGLGTLDLLYKESIDQFIDTHFFEINPATGTHQKIKREGVNLVLKIIELLG